MVLSETRGGLGRRGLTLLLVIRGGLRLDECLDVTAVGQNGPAETHPRTFVPGSIEITEAGHPHSTITGSIRALCRLYRQLVRIPELSSLPES